MERVLTVTFLCPICEKELSFPVFGEATPGERAWLKDPSVVKNTTEFVRHQHWCNVHRLCAICGKYVASGESGDLECAVNDGRVRVHTDYNDYFQKVVRGDISRLLIVHRACIKGKAGE